MANGLQAAAPQRSSRGGEPRRTVSGGFRPEIQGVRAVAVLLVAVYHIWFGRVSGGVDVFLTLTGFLLTGSLLRSVERAGRVRFFSFWARLARRLFPTVAVVLVGILVATYLWLPEARWPDTLGEVIASALYVENWQLALNSVDYLAEDNATSPLQHFWSLSIQGQFYLILPVLVAVAALVAARTRRALFILLTGVFVTSLAYSVYMTELNQPWAYFDTGARLWEFALGGMVAIALPYLNLRRELRIVAGWLGLVSLVMCGLVLQVSTVFPGWIALWPTGAALLIILAGTTGSKIGADRLLSARVFTYIGDISYALYLWHWPVLIIYLTVTEQDAVGLRGGAAILVTSIALAHVTTKLVDRGVAGFSDRIRTSFVLGLTALLVAVVGAGAWLGYLTYQNHRLQQLADDPGNYPGAAALHTKMELPDVPILPTASQAKLDRHVMADDGCQQKKTSSEVLVCTYGDPNGSRTIALAGSSLSAHWFPALNRVATANGWRVITLVRSGCPLAGVADLKHEESCQEWQAGALDKLVELKPDLVVTQGTRASGENGESIPPGYARIWDRLDAAGIDLLALRDTPRSQYIPAECIERNGLEECYTNVDFDMAAAPPYANVDAPPNVRFADLTAELCHPDGRCPPVIGNVLVYRDGRHLTATYARTMAPALEREVRDALGLPG